MVTVSIKRKKRGFILTTNDETLYIINEECLIWHLDNVLRLTSQTIVEALEFLYKKGPVEFDLVS